MGKALSDEYTTTRGVEEGCALSPLLFVVYLQAVFKRILELIPDQLKATTGIKIHSQAAGIYQEELLLHDVGVEKLWVLAYADDIVFFHRTPAEAQVIMPFVRQALREFGMDFDLENDNKCQYMCINPKENDVTTYTIDGTALKKTEMYKYLGAQVETSGLSTKDLEVRLAMVWAKYRKYSYIFECRELSI